MFLISKKVRESLLVLLLVGSVIASLLIGHSAPVVAQQVSPTSNAKPSIVLIHGAYVDGTSWQHVIPLLEQDGYTVTAVQIPLTSLAEDIAVTKRVIEAQKGAVVVAGHSYGGNVMTGAAAGNPQVKGLVYINALAPDAGETTNDLGSRYAAPPISKAIVSDTASFLYVDREKFHALFAGDVSDAEAQVMAATQKPIASAAFDQSISDIAWKTIPSWYLVTQADQAINPDLQRFMAQRMGATTIEVNSSHVSPVSHPNEVAKLIEAAAA